MRRNIARAWIVRVAAQSGAEGSISGSRSLILAKLSVIFWVAKEHGTTGAIRKLAL
jgi:hypothetical protein